MRLVLTTFFLLALIFSAQASPIPFDPNVLFDLGGDATDINLTTGGATIMLTNGGNAGTSNFLGGGIFVFHNIGGDITTFDLSVEFNVGQFPEGFFVDPTIVIPPSPLHQQSSFMATLFPHRFCADLTSFAETHSCVLMEFGLHPGPLIPHDTNFILDFDSKDPTTGQYTGKDLEIATGFCTANPTSPDCMTDTSDARVGGWQSGGTSVVGAPEPGYGVALLLCAAGLRIYYRRLQRRS